MAPGKMGINLPDMEKWSSELLECIYGVRPAQKGTMPVKACVVTLSEIETAMDKAWMFV